MRSRTPPGLAGRCPACFLPCDLCLCAEIVRVPNRTELVLLQHAKEAMRTSNTARLAALALERFTRVPFGDQDRPLDDTPLSAPGTWLLYPGASAPPPDAAPARLVVLDGTWAQARRMLHRVPALRGLPRLSLSPPDRAPPRLRRQRTPEGMSTIEAIAFALARLEGASLAAPLLHLQALQVRRVHESKGRGPAARAGATPRDAA